MLAHPHSRHTRRRPCHDRPDARPRAGGPADRADPGPAGGGRAGRQLTYAELGTRADALAHALVAHGAAPDRPVGVLLPRGLDLVVTLLAVWRAGAAYLPLDPGHPSARLSGLIEQTGLTLIVTDHTGHPGSPQPAPPRYSPTLRPRRRGSRGPSRSRTGPRT
ncbi:AMP-binding protein [Streptomyces nogalater]